MTINGPRLYFTFLHIALVGLVIEVIILADQNETLKGSGVASDQIDVGDRFGFDGLDPQISSDRKIVPPARNLVFVFTSTCTYCRENMEAWSLIAEIWRSPHTSVVGVCVDDMPSADACVKDRANYPVHIAIDPKRFRERKKLPRIPQTILLSSNGTVERVWTGVLTDEMIKEVAEAISSD